VLHLFVDEVRRDCYLLVAGRSLLANRGAGGDWRRRIDPLLADVVDLGRL
jgi:hypothetical protein